MKFREFDDFRNELNEHIGQAKSILFLVNTYFEQQGTDPLAERLLGPLYLVEDELEAAEDLISNTHHPDEGRVAAATKKLLEDTLHPKASGARASNKT